jgi:cytochrome c-type biogenesis protein CcmH
MTPTFWFWVAAAALIVAALSFLLPALLRTRRGQDGPARRALEMDEHRMQLEELRAQAAHGELSAADLRAAEDELRRRRADLPPPAAPRSRLWSPAWLAALIVAVALPLFAVGLYFVIGTPRVPDEPAPATQAEYLAQLQRHLERQPNDARGWVLLARAQADRDDFTAAAAAYERAVRAPGSRAARDPTVLTEYADAIGMTQGGRLAGRPATLILQALEVNPTHPAALDMAGSFAVEEGRYEDAVRYWSELLKQLVPGSQRHRELAAAIERVRGAQAGQPTR